MKRTIYVLLASFFLSTCSKDKVQVSEPYSEHRIYFESFDTDPNWALLPSSPPYHPDTTCLKVQNGLLKMYFDQPLKNCGCAWVGVNYEQQKLLVNKLLDRIGIRVRLKGGFFQSITRYHDAIDGQGNQSQIGEMVSFSSFSLNFNGLSIEFPNSVNGNFAQGSNIDFNANKLTGNEFEVIYDRGMKSFLIDGVEQPLDKLYYSRQNTPIYPLYIYIWMGHLPELSPRLDKLLIDEIEIYTWTGNK